MEVFLQKVLLTKRRALRLEHEAAGDRVVFLQLLRESVARLWLKRHGVPSWRNPLTPSSESGVLVAGRYSILLPDGSRLLVSSFPTPALSIETLASAKCFGVISVELFEESLAGSVKGFAFLRDLSEKPAIFGFRETGLESASVLLHYLPVFSSLKTFCFVLILLFFGEPSVPEDGTSGVKAFSPETPG